MLETLWSENPDQRPTFVQIVETLKHEMKNVCLPLVRVH